jgi:hypothetical protein
VWVIRAVQVALFAATLLTTYAVAHRLGLDEWTARLSVALMALPPAMLTLYTTATLGGYGETLLFGNLLILTALSLHTKRLASNLQPPRHPRQQQATPDRTGRGQVAGQTRDPRPYRSRAGGRPPTTNLQTG